MLVRRRALTMEAVLVLTGTMPLHLSQGVHYTDRGLVLRTLEEPVALIITTSLLVQVNNNIIILFSL
jgi:hypothetical protein